MRIFNRRRTSKAPYARHSFTPSTPPAAARIADGFPLSAVGRPRRHGLRSRCFTASKGKPLHFTARSHPADARQNRDEYPCACLCPTVPARPYACLSENRFHKRKRPPSSKRAPPDKRPAAKHPSLRHDDCGLPAITTLFRSPAGTP